MCNTENFVPVVVPRLSSSSSGYSRSSTGKPKRSSQIQKTKSEKKGNSQATSSRLRDLREWLEEFTDNLEDTEMPAPAHISHDSDSERPAKVAPRKHSICTHFPRDNSCEICKQTKITRAPCRRRTGGAVPRAENFGDLITADHKVLNEGCESRDNHQRTQWIQSYPCKTKT